MDKRVTIRLTNTELAHCNKISKGNLSYYIRELIQRDMRGCEPLTNTNVYVPSTKGTTSDSRQAKNDSADINGVARNTIRDMFNF